MRTGGGMGNLKKKKKFNFIGKEENVKLEEVCTRGLGGVDLGK